uniref:Ubiquitin-like protein ATG12 n=1 Tax=Romanomermis culicivorax TaxID=13658 RepID=A0A915JW40_ROMCU
MEQNSNSVPADNPKDQDDQTNSIEEVNIETECKTIESSSSTTTGQKVELILKPVGDTPIIKQKKWSLPNFRTVGWVNAFVRKYLRLEQSDSLYLFVNQSFAPNPDSEVGDLLECFGSDGKLVIHYSKTKAWG